MSRLHLDFETRSACDLRKTGAYIYAMDMTTDAWCMGYAFDAEPVQMWKMGEPLPERIREHILSGGICVAHNAAFERVIFEYVMGPRYGWPVPKIPQWRCTMAMAYAMALPGALDGAAAATGLRERKDAAGSRLMMQMAKPRKATPLTWWDDDDRKNRLYAYCAQDVEVERKLEKLLLPLSDREQQIWELDQAMNDRGVQIDLHLCNQAMVLVDKAKTVLDKELKTITNGEVQSNTNVSDLVKWMHSEGVHTDSVAKDVIDEMLGGWDLSAPVRRALEIRREAAKTSTAKVDKIVLMTAADGRMRGNLQYHGAGTGRWAGRGAQLQNLPRPGIDDVDGAISVLEKCSEPRVMELCYGPPISVVSDCIRGMITARKGYDVIAADYSAIEARVIAWLAGEEATLQLFRDKKDAYCVAAGKIYQRVITKADDLERRVGKTAVLALGFQGGAEAFAKMAGTYGVQLEPLCEDMILLAEGDNYEKAVKGWDMRGKGKSKLGYEAWLAAELIKLAWRDANPSIVRLWSGLEDAAVAAVSAPGTMHSYKMVKYKVSGSFLFCQLPSRRVICYPYPRSVDNELPWGGTKPGIVYKAVDSTTNKWQDKKFYGGLAAENVTQAVARDLMADAMLRVDAAGYTPIITIHDEVVCEVPRGFGSVEAFEALLCEIPPWAVGCPIAAEGWRGERYRK